MISTDFALALLSARTAPRWNKIAAFHGVQWLLIHIARANAQTIAMSSRNGETQRGRVSLGLWRVHVRTDEERGR